MLTQAATEVTLPTLAERRDPIGQFQQFRGRGDPLDAGDDEIWQDGTVAILQQVAQSSQASGMLQLTFMDEPPFLHERGQGFGPLGGQLLTDMTTGNETLRELAREIRTNGDEYLSAVGTDPAATQQAFEFVKGVSELDPGDLTPEQTLFVVEVLHRAELFDDMILWPKHRGPTPELTDDGIMLPEKASQDFFKVILRDDKTAAAFKPGFGAALTDHMHTGAARGPGHEWAREAGAIMQDLQNALASDLFSDAKGRDQIESFFADAVSAGVSLVPQAGPALSLVADTAGEDITGRHTEQAREQWNSNQAAFADVIENAVLSAYVATGKLEPPEGYTVIGEDGQLHLSSLDTMRGSFGDSNDWASQVRNTHPEIKDAIAEAQLSREGQKDDK